MEKKIDRRKKRTKKLLRQAMLELMKEKGVKGITVSDLTARADINRGTFYLHYRDAEDLLEQEQDAFFEQLREKVSLVDIQELMKTGSEPYTKMVSVVELMKEHADFLRVLFGPKGDPSFTVKWKQFMTWELSKKLDTLPVKEEKLPVPPEYLITFIISAQLGVIQHWLESGMEQPPEAIVSFISHMAAAGPLGTLQEKGGFL
ncbi:TetR/AcrR family transcriptional regulator [Salibacterium aidingense]|uniref:TetR/AcrR family transcriptional regulator n=1 Tax=Salibacterium aidingense TaxID=384933 RepID=UPI003BD96B96